MGDNRKLSPGGGPTRNTTLPTEAAARKTFPVATGFLDYFPDAIAAIANLSYRGSQQHNPGKPLMWDRSKSTDEDDTAMRHFLQRGTLDNDGVRHTVKACWRMLAFLQKEIETEQLADSLLEKRQGLMAATHRGVKCKSLSITPCYGTFRPEMGMCDSHAAEFERDFTGRFPARKREDR